MKQTIFILKTEMIFSKYKNFQRIARRDKKAFLSDQCKELRKTIE